jgi:hypothetical protein
MMNEAEETENQMLVLERDKRTWIKRLLLGTQISRKLFWCRHGLREYTLMHNPHFFTQKYPFLSQKVRSLTLKLDGANMSVLY